jgi:Cadherin domain/RTX calcium-binding nonapeptide repeat (4 copies)
MPSYIRTRTEFAVNSFTSASQAAPSVSTFADGGFIVVWTTADPAQDGSGNAVKAQLFDSAGSKVGMEFLINSAASGNQTTPSVAALSNGNFIVSWLTQLSEDGSDGIKAQLYSRNGDRIGGEFQVNLSTSGSHFTPNVAALANGGFVISWDDWDGFDMKARIFDAVGAPVGGEFRVNTNADYFQEYGDIVGLANGGFVATWRTTDSSADGSDHAVKAQIFNSSGGKVGAEFLVNSQSAGFQYWPSVTALASGGFVVTWYTTDTTQDGSESAIKAQVFTATGAKLGGEFRVNTQGAGLQQDPAVTATPDGGFVIAWTTWNAGQDGNSAAIKAQSFDKNGTKLGGEMLVNMLTDGAQFAPDLATLADGRVIVTWASESGDIDGASLRAQILGTTPAAPLPNTRPIIISNGGGTSVALTHDEGETAITTVVASDDGEPNDLRYFISGGGNSDLFRIDPWTGQLSWVQPPQFDPSGSNFYTVTVNATDGQLSGFQTIQLSVRHVNHVTIVSDGGYDWAQIWFDENQTSVTTVSAVDEDGAALTYSITGGDDAYLFTIDAQTGALSFIAAPDYERPEDGHRDNVYEILVTASDGTRSDTQFLGIFVQDVEDAPGFEITSDGGGDDGLIVMDENNRSVTAVTTQGAAGAVTYAITGGYDASLFTIDAATGALSFIDAPDFENPPYSGPGSHYSYYGGYHVVVGASDGTSLDEQELKIVVQDVDEAPVFYSYWGAEGVELFLWENDPQVGQVHASDPDQYAWVSYGLTGADAALFEIDPYDGTIRFANPAGADFEAPADADADHLYEVTVVAYSGMLSATQSFWIWVSDVYEGPFITSDGGGDAASLWVAENFTSVTVVAAEGGSSGAIFYEIVGGADASAFVIDAATGALEFAFAPNFEGTSDFDHDNVFDVIVRASDGWNVDDQSLSVNLYDIDEDPEFFDYLNGETAQLWVTENQYHVGDLLAFDPDGGSGPITYSITGGADASAFEIDPNTGSLAFTHTRRPDFEAPGDAGGDHVYDLVVAAAWGSSSKSRAFSVTVVDEQEGVFITSNGGGASASIAVDEGQKQVTTVVAYDPDGGTPFYTISGGADAARFTIDRQSGVLTFIETPDHESPADAGGDNVYNVTVKAGDGIDSIRQNLVITVGNVNERPTIVSNGGGTSASIDLDEGETFVTTVLAVDDGGPNAVHYSITGGGSADLFAIDAVTGELFFREAPDYENPAEGGGNFYSVVVTADDGELSTAQLIQVMVNNVYEDVRFDAPSRAFSIDENLVAVGAVSARAEEGATLHYSIMPGGDGGYFSINGETGELRFDYAPDHEIPADSNWDNVYNLTVSVTDGISTAVQSVSVTVGDIDEGVYFVSYDGAAEVALTKGENVFRVGQVVAYDEDWEITYSIVGGADAALFQVDPVTGELTFRYEARPDFEAPTDSDGDNVYEVTVAASGAQFTGTQSFSVTIANNNEGVWITSNGGDWRGDVTIAENSKAVTIVTAFDPDGTVPIFQIVGGADAARFTIDAQSGALSFVNAPDYESWADADGDNVYHVMVAANDGDFATAQDLFVTIADVDEPVEIVSYGGADSVSLTMAEEYYIVGQVAAEDDGFGTFDPIVFTITGGADAALFTVDRYSGKLNFHYDLAPDFENPSDADGDNVYDVVVTATTLTSSDSQAFAINVVNRNEGIWITSPGWWADITVAENSRAVATVIAEDPDGTVPTYSIAGGADAARFTIDAQTGVLSFIDAPDYESPTDVGADNVYNVTVAATDGEITTSTDLRIVVGDVDDAVRIVSYGEADIVIQEVAENQTAAAQLEAVSPNGGPVTYSITGGDDAALFAVDSESGALRFIASQDFELPADADGNGVYMVTVTASDGGSSDTQIFGLILSNVNEGVVITSNGGGASASVSANENQRSVATIVAEDYDETFPTFAIVGGADASRFTIDAQSGVLQFVTAPNREAPGDVGGDNVYDVIVRATDGSLFDDQAIAVTVANVDEGVAITSYIGQDNVSLATAENGTAVGQVFAVDVEGDPVTYAIVGGADAALFVVDSATGALRFAAAPNFEAPGDSNGDNVYKVEVAAISGAFTDTQSFAVTVYNANEPLAITSNGGGTAASISVGENGRGVTTVVAADPDGTATTYSIVGGADSARFTINAQTGLLEFVAAPDYEIAGDANGDNVYTVIVQASDGFYGDLQTLSVSVLNLRDGNIVTGTTGADSISGTSTNPALRTSNSEDTVSGRDGHDIILGLGGDDILNGDAGNDTLTGGAGADRLTGGLGKDEFVFTAASESTPGARDVITDFSRSQNDKISLSGIDANSALSGNQAFTFIGAATFSGVAGQLRYVSSGGVTLVSGDVNGDGIADFQIELTGTLAPVASDFVL